MFPRKSLFIIFTWIFAFFGTIILFPKVFTFFKPIIIAYLISLLLAPIANFLKNKIKYINKASATGIVMIILVAIISFLFYFVGNVVIDEAVSLYDNLPRIIQNTKDSFNYFLDSLQNLLNNSGIRFEEFKMGDTSSILTKITGIYEPLTNFGKNLPIMLINFIFILLFTFFFTLHSDKSKEVFKKIIGKNNYKKIFLEIKRIVGGYFLAQCKLFVIIAIVLLIGFIIMKIDYYFILAIIVGILDALPFFGTGAFLGPYAIYCFFQKDYKLVLECAVLYLLTQIIRRILEPKLIGDSIGISSFFSLFCMYIGYKIFDVIGLIIGVPIGVILLYLFKLGAFKSLIDSFKNIYNWGLEKVNSNGEK